MKHECNRLNKGDTVHGSSVQSLKSMKVFNEQYLAELPGKEPSR